MRVTAPYRSRSVVGVVSPLCQYVLDCLLLSSPNLLVWIFFCACPFALMLRSQVAHAMLQLKISIISGQSLINGWVAHTIFELKWTIYSMPSFKQRTRRRYHAELEQSVYAPAQTQATGGSLIQCLSSNDQHTSGPASTGRWVA
jgi:hypothetical protein